MTVYVLLLKNLKQRLALQDILFVWYPVVSTNGTLIALDAGTDSYAKVTATLTLIAENKGLDILSTQVVYKMPPDGLNAAEFLGIASALRANRE